MQLIGSPARCLCALGVVLAATLPASASDIPVSGAAPMPAITPGGERGPDVPQFDVAPGLKVDVAIATPQNSRFLEFDNFKNLYISSPNAGKISTYKLQPDGTYKLIAAVVEGKPTVHGMCFFDGWLLVHNLGRDLQGQGPRRRNSAR